MRISVALAALLLLVGCPREPENAGSRGTSQDVTLEVPHLDAGGIVASASEGVRFGRENAKVGARSHQHVLAKSVWDEQTASYESEFVLEVLAVDGPAPSRVKIEFRKNESFDNVSHQATSVDGHAYIVDVHAPHVVLAGTSAAPSEDEVQRVTDVVPDLGTRTQIDQVLPDDAMRIGEHRDDLTHAIARILHPRIWSVDKGSAILSRTDHGEAVFQIAMDARSSATGMKIAVRGEARVRLRDARLEGFTLKGDFTRANGEKGEFSVERRVRDD